MACTSVSISGTPAAAAKDHRHDGLQRSESSGDIRRGMAGMRRSRSEPQLRCSLRVPRAAAPARLKSSRSSGMLPFQFSGSLLPSSLRSFKFDSEEEAAGRGMRLVDHEDIDEVPPGSEEGIGNEKRSNWVERLQELRSRWRDRQHKDGEKLADEDDGGEEDYTCGAIYDSAEEEEESEWDRESFSRFLIQVPWSDTKLFSQLAFLCNMAYVIPEMKAEDLRRYYDLRLVTSSLEKKSEAAAIKAKLEKDSTLPPPACSGPDLGSGAGCEKNRPIHPSVAYEIAASAASYVHSRAKGLLSLGGGSGSVPASHGEDDATRSGVPEGGPAAVTAPARVYKSEVAAYVAASTMTAVVAAEETARQEAAKDLQSLHSSPCEWFVCDEPSTCTRCFVVQGSDSLASWQANLFFEPTKFEGTEVLVHRGIYEAAKGIYEQFMPEIQAHLRLHGDRARLRFTGHSLGGSLSLLVSLMLLSRGAIPLSALLPVVTFGSPAVFCGGHRVLDELGLEEGHVCSVMMHRDIVPRAFSCNYHNHVAVVLKRINAAFRSHPCLNNNKLLYSPLGQLYILQPDDKSSPPHPLLPPGAALYALDMPAGGGGSAARAMKAFLNSPHPLETLSDPTAYGSEGTILRDHDSSNYLKAVNGLLRQHTKTVVRRSRRLRLHQLWPLLTTTAGQSWGGRHESSLEKQAEVVTGA